MKICKHDIVTISHREQIGFNAVKKFVATGVSIDSRTIQKGDVFFAIRGDRFDGHDFISSAIAAGASAVIVESRWAEVNREMIMSIGVPSLIVDDTIHAFGELARIHRRKFSIPVIMVAGSNGKTTTKEFIAAVLRKKYRVLATEGNHNNHIGVPQTLFQLTSKYDVVVLEGGTNHPGELAELCSIAEPTHGLITNIGNEHLEFFATLDGVANAEGELFSYLRTHNGKVFLNADDQRLCRLAKGIRRVIRYGFRARQVAVRGLKLRLQENGCVEFYVKPQRGREFLITLGIPGEHNGMNALAAATVGLTFQVPKVQIANALKNVTSPSNRMEVLKVDSITILDDTYNANPDSMIAAFKTLSTLSGNGKRIAIVGDMLELGIDGAKFHREVGMAVKDFHIDVLWMYGTLARELYQSASVLEKKRFDSKDELIACAKEAIKPGDIILVKGSRGMKMEEVVVELKNYFSQLIK